MRKSRENGLFMDIPDELWNDWHWQVENRIETVEDLKKFSGKKYHGKKNHINKFKKTPK